MKNNFFQNIDGYIHIRKELVLDGNNETKILNAFQLVRNAEIREIYGEVIEGSITNLTGLRLTLFDGTLSVDLTANGGVLSGGGVGSFIVKDEDAVETIKVSLSDQARVIESIAAKDTYQSLFVTQKNGVDTFIRFHYTTTETPINAKIQLVLAYRQVNGGVISPVP
jgi:hypothetical protein